MNHQLPVAIITGSSSGIGKAIAEKFYLEGYFVILNGRDEKKLKETEQNILRHSDFNPVSSPVNSSSQRTHSQRTYCWSGDVTDEQTTEKLLKILDENKLKVNVLVNNAGSFIQRPFASMTSEIWYDQFHIHVLAPFELIRKLIPYYVSTTAILNISSGLAAKPLATAIAYGSMKAAQVMATKTLALELAPIRVNCIMPGLVETPIHTFHSLSGKEREDALAKLNLLHPAGRVGKPQDIAEAAFFLCRPKNSWITGTSFSIDGGLNLK